MVQCNSCTEGSHHDCIAVSDKIWKNNSLEWKWDECEILGVFNIIDFTYCIYVYILLYYIILYYIILYYIILYYIDFIQ